MNTSTGEVISHEKFEELPTGKKRNWVQFSIGEQMRIKGILFKVHDVSNQRLVLNFVEKEKD